MTTSGACAWPFRRTWGSFNLADDVAAALSSAVEALKDLGAIVEKVDLGWDKRCQQTAVTHFNYLSGQIFKRDYGDPAQREQLTPYIRRFIECCDATTVEDVVAAREYSVEMYRSLSRVFERYDALVCPTVASTEIPADYGLTPGAVRDGSINSQLDLYLTYPFNTLSRCPVLAVPCGKGRNGVPIGMQIVAAPYDDSTVFRIAMAYEAANRRFWDTGELPEPANLGATPDQP